MWDWLESAHELRSRGEPFALVTVCGARGSTPREAGAKMIVTAKEALGTIGGGGVELQAIARARELLVSGRSECRPFALTPEAGHACGGTLEVLFEIVGRVPDVYVFGVGHVGQSLCQVLDGAPVRVHAVDERPEWLDHPALPSSVVRHGGTFREFIEKASWDAGSTYAVILTWSHVRDAEVLEAVLAHPNRYVGLIGSRRKAEVFRKSLLEKGFSPDSLRRVHCPMGLFVGGKTPREVAVSVAAQILSLLSSNETGAARPDVEK